MDLEKVEDTINSIWLELYIDLGMCKRVENVLKYTKPIGLVVGRELIKSK